jgi:hypothetical protein
MRLASAGLPSARQSEESRLSGRIAVARLADELEAGVFEAGAVTCPWMVVTTGGRDIPRRPASSGPRSVWSWMMSTSP